MKLHKGDITVQSIENSGTNFTFWIPVEKRCYGEEEVLDTDHEFTTRMEEFVGLEFKRSDHFVLDMSGSTQQKVLLVDDNQELLSFLNEILRGKYQIRTAADGLQAMNILAKWKPDLIISDILMPEMDGLELAHYIKSNLETSHIPVVLLTAKTEVEDKYRGLDTGADLYIEKPFYPQILLKNIENIFSTKAHLIRMFKHDLNMGPAEMTHSKSDRDFIERLAGIIHSNLDNPELDVAFLVSELNISRTLLHLKLKKIANCSATGFIRSIRLKEAARLLTTQDITISETAYATGFSHPAFFSRRFKEFFGCSPSEYGAK